MALSLDGKALAEAAHARLNRGRTWTGLIYFAIIGGSSGFWSQTIRRSESWSGRDLVVVGVIGVLFGLLLATIFHQDRIRKQDKELVKFFEENFSDDCSWKQEELTLKEAEAIRLKAKTDNLIQKYGSSHSS